MSRLIRARFEQRLPFNRNIGIFETFDDRRPMPLHRIVIGMDDTQKCIQGNVTNVLVVVQKKSSENVHRKHLEISVPSLDRSNESSYS